MYKEWGILLSFPIVKATRKQLWLVKYCYHLQKAILNFKKEYYIGDPGIIVHLNHHFKPLLNVTVPHLKKSKGQRRNINFFLFNE